jgi:hypothetical protein
VSPRNLRTALLIAGITLSGCNRIPSEVYEVIFEKSAFTAPIGIDAGQDDGVDAVANAKSQRIDNGFLPRIILPYYNNFDKSILSFLVQHGYSSVECVSMTNRLFTRDYCFVVHKPNITELGSIAQRHLLSITYSNKYNTTSFGTPLTIAALTFKYNLQSHNKNFPAVAQTFDGSGKAVLNPDTGRWQLEELSLSDRGTSIFVDYIHSHYLPYEPEHRAPGAADGTQATKDALSQTAPLPSSAPRPSSAGARSAQPVATLTQASRSKADASTAPKSATASERESSSKSEMNTKALFLVSRGAKFGYIDQAGRVVINIGFDSAGGFAEGLAPVEAGGKWGYIGEAGEIIISPRFDGAYPFSDGLAGVVVNGKVGYIDRTGTLVITPQFKRGMSVPSFHEGLLSVNVGGKWGYVDKTGETAITPRFDGAGSFREGLAAVEVGGQFGFVDKTGKYVIAPRFDFSFEFSEGLAYVKVGDKWGFIDKTGRYVIKPRFDAAQGFKEGLSAAGALTRNGYMMGYVDKTGRYVISPKFEGTWGFSGGLAAVKVHGKVGYIDKTGKIVITPQFDSAGQFTNGLAAVKQGYINKTGMLIWNAQN